MKRKEILGHKLRYLHIGNEHFKMNEHIENIDESIWYVCKICNLEIYWSGDSYRGSEDPWKTWDDRNHVKPLDVTCNEQMIKRLLE